MADSVPVCDVLSEAMEYLTKLGTNIRIRSENLRDKRIQKDKLRNTHAIHKAVDKVLLICELSKKSIENVETGVKNLLVQMEKAGATFGPGPKTQETTDSSVKFKHFIYNSCRLKIREKISVDHYISVKVVSTSMTLSMIEKYPVYHDCKLYRLRARKNHASISEGINSTIQDLDETKNSCTEVPTDTKDNSEIEHVHSAMPNEGIELQVENNDIVKERIKSDNNQLTIGHDQVSGNEIKQCNLYVDVIHSPKENKHESDCEIKLKVKKHRDKIKKFRHIKVMDSSSSSDNETNNEQVRSCDVVPNIDCNSEMSSIEIEENQDHIKNLKVSDKMKPLIKCVSLSKLLKPDRVKDDMKISEESKKSKDVVELSKQEGSNIKRKQNYSKSESTKVKNKKLRTSESCDEKNDEHTYWTLKRKEVESFEPKKFNVNISRLPKLTQSFLKKNNLSKITQMGSVLCEIWTDLSEDKTTSESEPKSKSMKIAGVSEDNSLMENVDINKVKDALLYDSDSDNIETCQVDKQNTQKSTSDTNDLDLKIKDTSINVLECQKTDGVKVHTDELTLCDIECISNRDKTTQEAEKQSTGTHEGILSDIKETGKTVMNFEKEQNCEDLSLLHVKPDSKMVIEPKEQDDYSQSLTRIDLKKQENIKSDTETETINVKKVKRNSLDKSSRKSQKSHRMNSGLCNVNDKVQNSDDSHVFGGSVSKEDTDKIKTAFRESDSKPQNDNKYENVCTLKQSHQDNSGCKFQNVGNLEECHGMVKKMLEKSNSESNNQTEDANTLRNALLADLDCHSHSESISDRDSKEQDVTKLKNLLLNDSDDEEGFKTLPHQSEKHPNEKISKEQEKKSLLETNIYIDSQDNIEDNTNRETEGHKEVTEEQLILPASSDEHENKHNSSKESQIVKSSLLKDSSGDIPNTSKKRKTSNEDLPQQSKRKHIIESMYAKKMLLTYSSSSDTEDEQLRNTLKEIKDHLLKGMSSDDDDDMGTADLFEKDKQNVDGGSLSRDDSSESESEQKKNSEASNRGKLDSDSKDTSCKEFISGSISDNSDKSKVDHSSATPDGSCSQNSDIQDTHDKEIDGLINLKSLKKTYRRRKSRSTENSHWSRSRRRRTMAKASGLISNEGFLEAESSSDAVSLSGSDHADNVDLEDMPRVKLTDINGDGIGHLAKDDLLGESDTSISHDDKKSYKKEEDTDEDNVKSKRRKTIAISSDSEAGSSRKKENNFRLSDFEDSEDESSEPVKNKRKKKVTDSDASGGSSDDGKKKRRRIKTLDESEGSGSDTENEGRNKHGRKNIRKVMSKNQLEEATKKAAREEKERIARIAERQKLYNNLEFDESGKPDEVVLEKVVLDFDPETKEPLIQVDRGLVKKLKPHQANGIKFMWDACFESVKRIKKDKGSGCILAHCMGLGKTLQVVSLTHTLLTHGSLTGVNRVLVVCPLSTVLNWVNEFRMWLKHAEADFEVDVYELSKFKQNSERAFQLSQWFEHGGVCVLGYEMFRNLSADKGKKFKKKILKNFQESLVDPGPDLVVCDEGHLLKNEKTSLSQSMNRVKTRRRIVLTGTPLQNNLKEYYCMVQFVKPNLLGKYNEYLNRFVNPITNGQYTDSTEHDIRVMKRRSHVLHKMLDGAVQRRDYGVLAPFLPPKHEYVLFITLTDVQIKLYHHYLDNYSRQPQPGKSSGFLFPDFQSLQRIWTHPLVLKYNSERYEIMQQKKREREEEDSEGSLVDFIDDDSTPDESSTEESSDDLSDVSDDSRKKSKKKKSGKKGKGKDSKVSSRRGTRANPIELDEDEPIETLEVKSENPTEWWMKLVSEEELEDMRNSHKLILLFDILRQCEAIGDKLLVFSQSLYSLDLIEHFLGKVDEATQAGRVDEKLGGHVGSWSPGVDYFRLDGSTSCENRSIWCKNFNRIDNQRARLFLISTRAGGLGINLVAANRVVIFDVSWNPSHDVQSIFRVYRFGQKKPCYVYRFLAMGTMEEKIYERQVTKQAISKRVIDEQQIDRHYAENDLAELYKFEPQPPLPRPLPPLPKDRLFAEMLKEHEAQIYKYHEHDSLLENKEEETLSEEERRAAWEDFENEKTRPPPQPFLSPYAMHNGMVQGLLAQQQQMAMATISAMLRKDMPNMSDQQLRETVPLILASNPGMFGGYDYGLMQKMSEIYKYAQPGMMNPAMMNPMNAGSAMSGGSGMGASSLHYEPPWQRQQQQLRLQQLMQHQNSMGAKYYAGGLGSRDPMAMALQQQRARELMHRPRARGRPPLASAAPRPPPAHAGPNNAGDVVNLDSD